MNVGEMRDPLKEICWLSNEVASINQAFEMRRRLNPHHTEENIAHETRHVMAILKSKFERMKQIYAENKEELDSRINLSEEEQKLLTAIDFYIQEDLERAFGMLGE